MPGTPQKTLAQSGGVDTGREPVILHSPALDDAIGSLNASLVLRLSLRTVSCGAGSASLLVMPSSMPVPARPSVMERLPFGGFREQPPLSGNLGVEAACKQQDRPVPGASDVPGRRDEAFGTQMPGSGTEVKWLRWEPWREAIFET